MNQKNQIILKKIVIIAMLTALCCAATFVQIKMPTGDMVHLGNFVMIMAALLLGGIAGGLVGSLGMGIYDLIFYTAKPSTIIRTFILKFLLGFIVGALFRLILKKKLNTNHLLIGAAIFFTVLFTVTFILFFVGDRSNLSFNTGLTSTIRNIFGSEKSFKISLFIPIFSFIFGLGMIFARIFGRKLSNRSKAALFAITVAVLVNILGEFLLRWTLEGIFNVAVGKLTIVDAFNTSIIVATSKIPGSVITGFITVFLAALVYEPVYFGVKNLSVFKDDTKEFDSNEVVETNNDNNSIKLDNTKLTHNN